MTESTKDQAGAVKSLAAAKPGWKTSEFWLTTVANLVGILLASGAIPDESGFGKSLGLAAIVLVTMGYTASRGKAKAGSK